MYDLKLEENEEVITIVDEVVISEDNDYKTTSIALTNKRILFLEAVKSFEDDVAATQASTYLKEKEVYYKVYLEDITSVDEDYFVINDRKIIIENADLIREIKRLTK